MASLPAPLGPTTSATRPGPRGKRPEALCGLEDPLAATINLEDNGQVLHQPNAHQIGAQSCTDLAPIGEASCTCRVQCDGSNRGRQGQTLRCGAPIRKRPSAGWPAHSRKTGYRARRRVRGLGRDVARMRAAAHDVRCAHQHRNPGPVRGRGGFRGGGKFGDRNPIVDRLVDMLECRVVVAGKCNSVVFARSTSAVRWRA